MTGERGSRFEPLRDHLPVVGLDGRQLGPPLHTAGGGDHEIPQSDHL
jgi:hypothetical protein